MCDLLERLSDSNVNCNSSTFSFGAANHYTDTHNAVGMAPLHQHGLYECQHAILLAHARS